MHTVYKRILEVKELLCDKFVRADHERLDNAVREVDRVSHDVINRTVVIQDNLCLRHLEIDRAAPVSHRLQYLCELLHLDEHRDDLAVFFIVFRLGISKDPEALLVAHSPVRSDNALIEVAAVNAALAVNQHLSRHGKSVDIGIKAAKAV